MKYILSLALAFFIQFSAFADDKPNVTLDVFTSQNAVQVGGSIDIAIRQNIRDGWHTYWINPGDSGEAMTIDWELPKGVSVSEVNEPTPNKFFYDPLVNFGHKGQPVFTQTLSLWPEYPTGTLNLKGTAYWLVCDDICIPESQDIHLSIPVIDGEVGQVNQDIFQQARSLMPEKTPWETRVSKQDDDIVINVEMPQSFFNQMTDVELYPYDWGLVKTTSDITSEINDNGVTFTAKADDRDISELEQSRFVIKVNGAAYEVNGKWGEAVSGVSGDRSLIAILLFAFVGGLILNLMPCVFPVLSMKALSLVKLSDKERSHARAHGLAYTVGIILSFLVIAGSLIALKGAGESIGWGFQLQDPYVVTTLATILFVVGLNLIGLFEFSSRFSSVGSKLTTGNDLKSSFFTGVLATSVATPCTAPFMASAIGYALTQSAFIGLLVFATLGLGLAFPYLLLTFAPAVQKILPRPGAWMDTFKQALAWPMFASVIWLVWVLVQQAGDMAVIYILALFLSITLLIWLAKKSSKVVLYGFVLALIIGFGSYAEILKPAQKMNYEAFDEDKLERVLAENPDQDIFVNMTAAWCITCLVNEQTSLSDEAVKTAFEDEDILYMKGDWTNRDEDITEYLENFGRNGVPLYVFYGKADESGMRPDPVLLPQILTPQIVIDHIKGDIK